MGPKPKKQGFRGAVKPAAVAADGLPILTYSEGRGQISTNFIAVKEKWSLHLQEKNGNAGRLLDDGVHYLPPEPEMPLLPDTMSNEQKAIEIEMYREARKLRLKEVHSLRECYPKQFAFMIAHMSVDSKAKVESDPNWELADRNKDDEALWQAIERTHMAATSAMAQTDKQKARAAYSAISQYPNESVSELRKRIEDSLKVYDAVEQARPDDLELAADFIAKLDVGRFATLISELENGARLGRDEFPKTLEDAYTLAYTWKVPLAAGDKGLRVVPAAAQQQRHAFVTGVSKSNDDEADIKKRSKKDKKKKKAVKKDTKRDVSSGGGGRPKPETKHAESDYDDDDDTGGVVCWACNTPGHRMSECPEIEANKQAYMDNKKKVGASCTAVSKLQNDYEDEAYVFVSAGSKSGMLPVLEPWEVGLDTMATDHVIASRELCDKLWRSPYDTEIIGVGGAITSNVEGHMPYFGSVNVGGPANLLSFARVCDEFDVSWCKKDLVFTVRAPDKIFEFRCKGGFFVCDMSDLWHESAKEMVFIQTVLGNEQLYTKRQVRDAKKAKEVFEELGFISTQDLVKMVKKGIPDCDVTVADVYRALKIYGPELGRLRGTTRKTKTESVKIDYIPKHIDVSLTMDVDIMFIMGIPFLIAVIGPMSYTMVNLLGSRSLASVRKALLHFVGRCKAEGFEVRVLRSDGEGAVIKMTDELQNMGVLVNPAGAGSHVPTVERKIGVVKGRVRGHINTLPFSICVTLLIWLVYFCVSRINLVPTSTMSEVIAPREAFNGTRISYKRDLGLKFGQYVEVHEQHQVTNTMASRTRPAIALCPKGNKQGSWNFFALDTDTAILRDNWTKLPMPNWIVEKLNKKAETDKKQVGSDPVFRRGQTVIDALDDGEDVPMRPDAVKVVEPNEEAEDFQPIVDQIPESELPSEGVPASEVILRGDEPREPSVDQAAVERVEYADNVEPAVIEPPAEQSQEPIAEQPNVEVLGSEPVPRKRKTKKVNFKTDSELTEQKEDQSLGGYNLRERRSRVVKDGSWRKTAEYGFHMTTNQALNKFGKEAVKSLCKEILQMHAKGVWRGVHLKDLSYKDKKRIIRSSVFFKAKYLSNGDFEKLKARLVAGGHMQDKGLYSESETASPTASLQSIYMVAGIAAQEKRTVVTADIGGAYLNADMKKVIHMRLDPKVAEVLAAMEPDYAKYISDDGSMVVTLMKALYGCVESAKLWYDNLSGKLLELGFVKNEKDQCVFNKVIDGNQCTIVIYVDDLLITCKSAKAIGCVLDELKQQYNEITIHNGDVHSYLGQTFDWSYPGKCKVTMEGYVNDLFEVYDVEGCAATPATEKLFQISEDSEALSGDMKDKFHSRVAKLLYLAKRVRPDILTAIAFLSTRIQAATVEDWSKLERVLKYINGSKDMGICIDMSDGVTVFAYVDSSYGVHSDYKSHTGGVISMGKGPVFTKSSKQKIMSKSSTEAELIGISDMLPQVIWTRDFLIAQGYKVAAAKLFQDNQSTIALANKGFSTSDKTRHIAIRYFFVKDRVDSGEIVLEYLPTERMTADVLTKPLQGTLFRTMRKELLNWD